ncbi:MAG TPA: 3-oxoacyl-[acyl-carrier-protein] synthase III C-terminal domain-containing protein [Archangium sp.]|jgi:3-oxoacyl-[acyl-carrier-protein] synthase-3|uniref:3-oxoacyl-[acyl-carrier-protein] synthase III C-terminal domain-containing protein n=1 Tax=Archangium sp. TaxID=1872627 RepID=UPI002ED8CA38
MSLKIAGVGRYLPPRVVLNPEIEARCGLPAGWIEEMQGVRERRWIVKESASFMGAEAAKEAVADAGLELKDIDLILNASGTPQQVIPDGGALLQRELGLGASGIPSMSVHTTCLSFLTALDVSNSLLSSGRYRSILIVSSDISSVGINFDNPETASLFGDAAAAVVVVKTPEGEGSRVLSARLETYGDDADLTTILGGGTRKHPNDPNTRPLDNLFHMDGRRVYMRAVGKLGNFLEKLRPGLSEGLGSIQLVVPHQPSKLGLRSLRKYNFPPEQVVETVDKLGNCIAASIPATLYEAVRGQRMKRGDEVLMVGTGAGLSLGGLILTY